MQSQNATALDLSAIITKLTCVREVHSLPSGAMVGDMHGGLTFTDAVAAALESRSLGGWQEAHGPAGEIWTVIMLNR